MAALTNSDENETVTKPPPPVEAREWGVSLLRLVLIRAVGDARQEWERAAASSAIGRWHRSLSPPTPADAAAAAVKSARV